MGMIETLRAIARGANTVREVHDKAPKGPGLTTIDAHCRTAVGLGFLKREPYKAGDGLGVMLQERKGRDDRRGRPPVRYAITAKGRAWLKAPPETYRRQDPSKSKRAAKAARKPKRKAAPRRPAKADPKALKAARDARYRAKRKAAKAQAQAQG